MQVQIKTFFKTWYQVKACHMEFDVGGGVFNSNVLNIRKQMKQWIFMFWPQDEGNWHEWVRRLHLRALLHRCEETGSGAAHHPGQPAGNSSLGWFWNILYIQSFVGAFPANIHFMLLWWRADDKLWMWDCFHFPACLFSTFLLLFVSWTSLMYLRSSSFNRVKLMHHGISE